MGYARPRPKRLAAKLLQIRNALGISQAEMLRQLGLEGEIPYFRISNYELDKNEPPLSVLLQYARLANVHLEVIADDELDLPDRIPSPTKSEGVKRARTQRAKKR